MKKTNVGRRRKHREAPAAEERGVSARARRDVDVEKALGDWHQVAERTRERRQRGETVRRVGTSEKRGRSVKRRGREQRRGRVVVKGKWISGRLTNREGIKAYVKRYLGRPAALKQRSDVRHYERYRKDLEKWLGGEGEVKRPARRRCLEAEHHTVALREARRCGVPTAAVTSGGAKRSEGRGRSVTYHVARPAVGGEEERIQRRTRRGRRERRREGAVKKST